MKVYHMADIEEGIILPIGSRKNMIGELVRMLTNLDEVKEPNADFSWRIEIILGKGESEKKLMLNLPVVISLSDDLNSPILLGNHQIIYFRDRLFMAERPPTKPAEHEEIVLRVKKAVYDEDVKLSSLRSVVANLEAAIEFSKSGPKRHTIPDDVKLVVWTRDGGACVRCGSQKNLHFDHVIPVSKGGGNTEENIQLLCQACNIRKADKIAIS